MLIISSFIWSFWLCILAEEAPSNLDVNCGFDDNELTSSDPSTKSPHEFSSWYVWFNGIIPFYFGRSNVSDNDKALFRRVMKNIEAHTCFRYEERDDEPDEHHLEITVDPSAPSCFTSGFSAYVSAVSEAKMLLRSRYQLADDARCDWDAGILHEMMHALGVGHTHRRADRDKYINVLWDNIKEKQKEQYQVCGRCEVYGEIPYECGSLMHYGTATFANGSGPTMEARDSDTCRLTKSGAAFTGGREPTENDWKMLRIVSEMVCVEDGSFLDGYTACLTSPNFPQNYPPHHRSTQNLSVAAGSSMEIRFQYMNVEYTVSCRYDYLQFYDGNGNPVGKKLCGRFLPKKIYIRTSEASVVFKSDSNNNDKGFKFCYKPVNIVDGGWTSWSFSTCNGTCTSATQRRERTCWNPPPSNGGIPCEGPDSEELVSCTPQHCVHGVWSSWGEFNSCSATCDDGTKTRIRTCSNPPPSGGGQPCNGSSTQSAKCNLRPCEEEKCETSPDYPGRYPNSKTLMYLLSIPFGHKIEITFWELDIEQGEYCRYDYLQFTDGNGNIVKKLCGSVLPEKFEIPTPTAEVKFHSDRSIRRKGFKFCYKSGGPTTPGTPPVELSCNGTDWDCCSSVRPCREGEGDCDYDSDCSGSLQCGEDNCQAVHDDALLGSDCCTKPGEDERGWSSWESWGDCSATCGAATKRRPRTCLSRDFLDILDDCPGLDYQIANCNLPLCGN